MENIKFEDNKVLIVDDTISQMELAEKYSKYRNTSVYRHHWERSNYKLNNSLANKINMAKTKSEVVEILKQGISTYKEASKKTIKMWNKIANQRIKELS